MRLAVLVGVCTIASSIVLAQDAGAPKPVEPRHFIHAKHAERGVDTTKCETCHRADAKGTILAPAAQGHAPCLEAACHATEFISVGASEKTRKLGPAFDKAAAFCTGCHEKVPWPWKKQTTRVIPSFAGAREYHVELNHYLHATRASEQGAAGCRGCHVVDGKSYELVSGAPGHGQCVTCHNAKDFPEFTMSQCGLCHQTPSRDAYFKTEVERRNLKHGAARPATRVRSCGGEAYTRLAAKNPKTPCFKHERVDHRTESGKADGTPLQCAKCHYVIAENRAADKYKSLVDLRVRPIIDNNKDRQHASCGRSGCHHASQVVPATCAESYCHADMSVY